MKRRSFVQGTSIRKQVLRQRRIHTSIAERWDSSKTTADGARQDVKKAVPKSD